MLLMGDRFLAVGSVVILTKVCKPSKPGSVLAEQGLQVRPGFPATLLGKGLLYGG